MHTRTNLRGRTAFLAAVLVAIGVSSATAAAVSVGGGPQVRMDNRTSTQFTVASSTTWVDIAGSEVTTTVPAGASRLVNARFTAESMCQSPAEGWCSVRIIAQDTASNAIIELDPASGMEFVFDSDAAGAATDRFEAHAMERSRRLGPGTYRLRVQGSATSNTIYFALDDWHFAVETSA